MFCKSLLCPFSLAIVLSVLRFTDFDYPFGIFKLFLKIPKGLSEAVNQRTDNNTMAKSKRTNGQAMSYKTLHRKLKLEQHSPIKNWDDHRCPDNVYKWSNITIGVITGAPIMYTNGATYLSG